MKAFVHQEAKVPAVLGVAAGFVVRRLLFSHRDSSLFRGPRATNIDRFQTVYRAID
jgi:hypothetical protein